MNLKKLFDMQKKLDEKILERFPHLRNEDLLPKKVLALQVELGELCNCWRGFKFWSNDQEPRTRHVEPDIEYFDKTREARWKESNPLLEEYVDCLHFILSIGLELDVKPYEFHYYKEDRIEKIFINLFQMISEIEYSQSLEMDYSNPYIETFNTFIHLGEKLGFTWKEVEVAYEDKNRTNHVRQESGY